MAKKIAEENVKGTVIRMLKRGKLSLEEIAEPKKTITLQNLERQGYPFFVGRSGSISCGSKEVVLEYHYFLKGILQNISVTPYNIFVIKKS